MNRVAITEAYQFYRMLPTKNTILNNIYNKRWTKKEDKKTNESKKVIMSKID